MLEWLTENWERVFEVIAQLVGVFAIIATMTPTKADNAVADKMAKVVHTLGANFGKAKNAG